MRSSDDVTPVDELIARVLQVPDGDSTERVHLATARSALDRVLDEAARGERVREPGRRRWRRSPASGPLIVSSLVVVLIAVVALTVLRPGPATRHSSSSPPATSPAAGALIARLSVLRRPQASADKLPGKLKITGSYGASLPTGTHGGVIIRSLTRLVATPPGARLYLVVTTPVSDGKALWRTSQGDQVTIVAITAEGATETPGYPAVELSDAGQIHRAGNLTPPIGGPGRRQTAQRNYDVAIVPDGVARVRWTFATLSGGPGRVVTASVHNNVAITRLTSSTAFVLHATWYAADGSVIPSSDAALVAAQAAQANADREQALRQAEQQQGTAPAKLLAAFAVFAFESPTGTKTSSGYTISRPPLSELPFAVLRLSIRQGLDLRQARHVIAPSGLDMWAIPGAQGLCVLATHQDKGPYGQVMTGSGGACSASVQQAESEGGGFSSGSGASRGSIIYGILPRTKHTATIQTGPHSHRTIHPADGVYIATTPFAYG